MKGFVIVILICGLYWWFWGRADGAVKTIEAQLQALDSGDFATAYDYLSDKAKAEMTPENFQNRVQKHAPVMAHASTKFYSRSIENDVATIAGTIESLDAKKTEARYVLIKEGDHWAIQSFSFQ